MLQCTPKFYHPTNRYDYPESAQLLGIKANKQEIADMLEKAGADEASELDSDAFKRIMTGVLTKSDTTPSTAALVWIHEIHVLYSLHTGAWHHTYCTT